MLKKITSKGDWETNNNTNIVSRGGVYVGTAKTPEDAKMFAASAKLLKLLNQLHPNDPFVHAKIIEIFEEV